MKVGTLEAASGMSPTHSWGVVGCLHWAITGPSYQGLLCAPVRAFVVLLTGNSFPLEKLQSPLKQVSISALAQLYLLPEETTFNEQKGCAFCNATSFWDRRGKAAGKMNNGWEGRGSGEVYVLLG